jgi:hypothetical protein
MRSLCDSAGYGNQAFGIAEFRFRFRIWGPGAVSRPAPIFRGAAGEWDPRAWASGSPGRRMDGPHNTVPDETQPWVQNLDWF